MYSRTLGPARLRLTLAAFAVAAALVLAAAPAMAVQYEKTSHYDGTDSWSYTDCGFEVAVDQHFWGTFATRQGTGRDASAFFGRSRYAFEEVHTRVSNGVSVRFSGHGQFIEVKATRIEGSVFQFTAVRAETLLLAYADGTVIARDAGNIRESILFDTLGDPTPGGNFIEQVSFRVNGPHAVGDVDWCALFN